MYRLGIDLGGTNIAAAVVDENYKIVGRGKVKTDLPRPAEEICDAMAEAAKAAFERIKAQSTKEDSDESQIPFVLATVEGDIHDIGKNLVVMMLKNYGFKVYDLGKDRSSNEIIEAAIKYNADIIGLSALMTTTMTEMQKVIQGVKNAGLDSKIMIGGAVITQDYADEILADGYAKDAAGAVLVANELSSEQNSKAGGMI